MADEDRDSNEYSVLECLLADLAGIPRCLVEALLFVGIAFNQVLDFAEHHLHEKRLRARPSAPYASEDNRKEDDENEKRNQQQREQHKVLRPERLTKDQKTSFKNS